MRKQFYSPPYRTFCDARDEEKYVTNKPHKTYYQVYVKLHLCISVIIKLFDNMCTEKKIRIEIEYEQVDSSSERRFLTLCKTQIYRILM